jgi:uncharacterized membrane protein YbhN (UPF0104 family)
VVEEVTGKAEVRQSSSSLLSATASFRRSAVASTGLTPGGFALVELAMTASGLHASAALAAVVAYRFISFWLVLLGGWVAFIALAHPLRRRLSRGSPGR